MSNLDFELDDILSEFRDPQGAEFTAQDIVRHDAEGGSIPEEALLPVSS